MNVLVLDDDANILEVVKFLLTSLGHQPIIMQNPLGALDCIKEKNIELVITDQTMPEMSGSELIQKIRSQPEYLEKPSIILFSGDLPENQRQAVSAKNVIFLPKPFDLEELKLAIQTLSHS